MRPKIPIRPNFYSGGRVDRADRLRRDPVALAEALAHPEALILPVWRNRHLVTQDLKPIRLIRRELENGIVDDHQVVFLGLEENRGVFALDLSPHETVEQHPAVAKRGEFRDLREFGPLLPAEEGALLAYARALLYWHQRHLFCGLCGNPTMSENCGHIRRCTNEACGTQHFPRTDPAVIMLVHDGGERCVLGRQKSWPAGRHSTLAGFVEPGESLEEAVAREIFEEVSLEIDPARVHYHSSQPWPFPSSIMLGFWAEADFAPLTPDEHELESARWFTREELRNSPEDETFGLPSHDSIARRLIEDWIALD